MDFYSPRKIKFKAWNTEARLLMRLNNIDCNRGELMKRGHILLQYTDQVDQHGEELYEMDVVLAGTLKKVVVWSHDPVGWYLVTLETPHHREVLTAALAKNFLRLCNYFELEKK